MAKEKLNRRDFLRWAAVAGAGATIAACATPTPQVVKETVVVEKPVEKVVTKEVEKVVKETVVVEKEKPVTQVVKETVAVAKKRTKVAFWHIYGSGPSRDVFDKIVAEFNTTNSDYIVEPAFTDFWTYEQKVLAAVAAGEPPEVTMADQTRAGQRAEAKQIISLDEYIQRDKFDMSVFWEYPIKDVTYKGKIWGIPYAPDTRLLFYNKDQFKEIGLDPNTPPKKWDDLWEYALKLDKKDAKGNLVRVGFNPMWGNVFVFPFLYNNGAILVDESGKPRFTDPEVIETAKWYKKWVDHYGKDNLNDFAAGFGTGAQDPFISGQVSMIIQTNSYIGNLQAYAPKEMSWGISLIPYNKEPASWGAGFDLEIPFSAKNPGGAWEFIKFLTSKEIQLMFAQASGSVPAQMEAARDPSLAKVPGWDMVLESMKVTKSRRFVLEAPTWYVPLVTGFQEVWDGVKTPEQAMTDAQAAVEKEIANYKATH